LALLARAQTAAGDQAKAEKSLRRAVSDDPRFTAGYAMLGQLYIQQRRLDEARGEFEGMVQRNPSAVDARTMVDFRGPVALIPPNSFALGRSVEYFRVPRNVLCTCVGKSTYARCGIITNVTPFEPEWEGFVTLEISNTTPLPAKIYANEGVAQMLFFESDEVCETSYRDRGGKYQDQQGVTLPKM